MKSGEAWQERTEMLLGPEGLARLAAASVTVVGAGGVGAAAAEMLVRAGVGHLTVIDSDSFSESNINRQLPALHSTVGLCKVDVLRSRLMDINPSLDLTTVESFLSEENMCIGAADCIVDAIDTLSPKIALIQHCMKNGLYLVSSMGSGAKLDVTKVRIADISKTRMCPLAHMLRKRLHKLGIVSGFLAVYSEEVPRRESVVIEESRNKKSQVGTISYLPTVFGCACAQAVITYIAGIDNNL
ncbi:MAG: tRNA threonylcarbamoyladenosine dehydratase [Bacteroidales bacterium]|nr:tRNA threonylcarbamoyladenosine dehydratase [Bacteroidales bacterium]